MNYNLKNYFPFPFKVNTDDDKDYTAKSVLVMAEVKKKSRLNKTRRIKEEQNAKNNGING